MDDSKHLTIDELKARCQEESGRARPEPAVGFSSCWELFRRAIVMNDQQAWQLLYDQYRRLVGKWAWSTDLELDDLVTEVFARFWQGIRGHDFTLRFPTMPKVMQYLKRCARSVSIDAARRQDYQQKVWESLAAEARTASDPPRDEALDQFFSKELRAYLRSQMQDEEERIVFDAYCSGLKPREIAVRFPDRFTDARQIYGIRERIVKRLNDDPMVQKWWTA